MKNNLFSEFKGTRKNNPVLKFPIFAPKVFHMTFGVDPDIYQPYSFVKMQIH